VRDRSPGEKEACSWLEGSQIVHDVSETGHASTEQLSALLDERAEPHERQFLAGHVEGCPVCSNELADLRSVRSLLRALPVHLPPRSFAIPVEEAAPPPRRFGRLIPLTRVLGTLAAVLCVVLFSVDAMRVSSNSAAAPVPADALFQISTTPRTTSLAAAKPAEVQKASDTPGAAEAAKPAAAAPQSAARPSVAAAPTMTAPSGGAIANTAPQPAAPPPAADAAAGRPQPAAPQAAAAQAPATGQIRSGGGAAPQPTVSSFTQSQAQANPTAVATSPSQQAANSTGVIQRPPEIQSSPWLSPLRLWAISFAVIAALLLVGSLLLGRIGRARPRPGEPGFRR
jgi:hypothetical protein